MSDYTTTPPASQEAPSPDLSKPSGSKPASSVSSDRSRGSTITNGMRLLALNGSVTPPISFKNPSVTFPDLCQLHSITWSETLRIKIVPIVSVSASAFTAFDQLMIIQIIAIISMCHTEFYSPISNRRDELTTLYRYLMRTYGNMKLLDQEVRFIESILAHEITDINGTQHTVMAVLPDTPGIDTSDDTGYSIDSTALYYTSAPWLIFDHMYANSVGADERFNNLEHAPAAYPTSLLPRSAGKAGTSKIVKSSIKSMLSHEYRPHTALPSLENTWTYWMKPTGSPVLFQWLTKLATRRNQTIAHAQVPHSSKTISTIFGNTHAPTTLRSNDDLLVVQRPFTPRDAATAANGHPNRADMLQTFHCATSIRISDDDMASGTALAYNSYYGNYATNGTFIGSVSAAPLQNASSRELPTAAPRPIPAWTGPIMIGTLFSTPLMTIYAN
jgi:hypothetical protein